MKATNMFQKYILVLPPVLLSILLQQIHDLQLAWPVGWGFPRGIGDVLKYYYHI